jgi:hypothetical protein
MESMHEAGKEKTKGESLPTAFRIQRSASLLSASIRSNPKDRSFPDALSIGLLGGFE